MREMWAVTKAEEARIDLFHSEYIDKNGKKKMKVDEDLRDQLKKMGFKWKTLKSDG